MPPVTPALEPSEARADAPAVVIKPRPGWHKLNLKELWTARDLIWSFAIRDVKLRYRQTVLGIVWSILQPLAAAGIFSFVFSGVANLSSGDVPYFLFAFGGMAAWVIFYGNLVKVSNCLVMYQEMIGKVYFPRLALPVSAALSPLIDFTVALVILAVVLAISGVIPGAAVFVLPVWILLLALLSFAIGLFAAALMVRYRDFMYLMPILVQLILYASPVGYSLDAVPEGARDIFSLNPLVGLLEGFRWSVLPDQDLPLGLVAYSVAATAVLLIASVLYFRRQEQEFADVI